MVLRALLCAFFSALSVSVAPIGAQSSAPPVPAVPVRRTAPAVPTAAWDSLCLRRDYFALRDSVDAWRGPDTPELRYFRGLVAHAFNDPDGAVSDLKPLLDSAPHVLTPDQLRRAADALARSYLALYRYRESGEVYRLVLGRLRSTLDSSGRAELVSSANLSETLRDVLPQRVVWKRASTLDTIPNGGQRYHVQLVMNASPVTEPLIFSTRARMTVIDSTTAATHGVKTLGAGIPVMSVSGQPTTAGVGVIPTLEMGSAIISNAVVLVYRDTDLTVPQTGAHVTGIIGFPVMNALGRVSFTRDGHVAISSPGITRMDTTVAGQLALVDQTPVVEAFHDDRRVTLTVDMRADTTVLYSVFASRFSQDSASLRRSVATVHRFPARMLGDRWQSATEVPATTWHGVGLTIGGHAIRLPSIDVLSEPVGGDGAFYDGTLGADVLQHTDAVTFDFGAMTVGLQNRPSPAVLPTISYPTEAPSTAHGVPQELGFIVLLFALFLVPKALQRYRIPGAITSLLMGGVLSGFGLFQNDPTLHLLSTLGIVALFLFAGLEIDGRELQRNVSPLVLHAVIWTALATVTACGASLMLGLSARASALIALALVTPSTGFILSSLGTLGLTTAEQRTVKTYAVGSELLALSGLFFVLQSTSVERLALAIAAMLGVVIIIPLAFRFFAAVVAPYAPRSEFAFLVMVAVVCAYATRRLGVYYLVGAFLVGVAAQRFRSDHPAMSSEKMVDALESFGSVFIPFYFFYAGTEIARDQLTPKAVGLGLLLALVFIPLRIAAIALHRRLALREAFVVARRLGGALVPTLVFTLVIVGILHDKFDLPNDIAGALVLYTILNTTIPAYVLHSTPPDFEEASASAVEMDDEPTGAAPMRAEERPHRAHGSGRRLPQK